MTTKTEMPGPAEHYSYNLQDFRYFEDLEQGAEFNCGDFAFSEADIIDFASKFDPQPIHTDPEAAKAGFAGALTASGYHSYAATMCVFGQAVPKLRLIAGLKLREIDLKRPVFANAKVRVQGRWVKLTPSKSKPDRGAVEWEADALDADGNVILTCGATVLVKRQTA